MHASGRAATRQFAPQHRRQGEADQVIECAPRQVSVDKFVIQVAGIGERVEDRIAGDLVKYYPLDFDFVERLREAGVKVPIVPGIMPITNVGQIERFTRMCGATIPEELSERLHSVAEDPAVVMATGIEHAITQCRELLEKGAPGLHFYTLNKSHATRSILAALR